MRLLLLTLIFIGLPTIQIMAQEKKPAGKPAVLMVDAISITATVEAIDYDKRTVALKGPRGNVLVVKAGPGSEEF